MNSVPTIIRRGPLLGWLSLALGIAAVLLVTLRRDAPAATTRSPEHQIKAAFLFNFAQFIEWPTNALPQPQSPLVIGILGPDPFGTALDEIVRGEAVKGHPLVIQRYRQAEDVGACHILFVNEADPTRLERIIARLNGRNILTVGDAEAFTQRGGMIRFFTEQNKIRLEINAGAAQKAGLTISSRLLRLARIVSPPPN
jgi:hypothetical protein